MRPGWLLFLFLLPLAAESKPWWLSGSNANQADFLEPDQAFRVYSRIDGRLIRVGFTIADGYYLYRSRFDIKAESPDLAIEAPIFPRGLSKTDEYLGTQEIYEHHVEAIVGFRQTDAGAHPIQIRIGYQGCATAGLCYPPMVKILTPARAVPEPPTVRQRGADPSWVAVPILGGVGAFFVAGWILRRRQDPRALD